MVSFTAKSDLGQERKVAENLRHQWIQYVLENTGINWEGCFEEVPENLTIEQKAKIRKILEQNKIIIKDNFDGSVDIYVEEEKIGSWYKPYYILHNINKYVEIQLKCESVFDEEK